MGCKGKQLRKALGNGVPGCPPLLKIENTEFAAREKPLLQLHGKAAKVAAKMGIKGFGR